MSFTPMAKMTIRETVQDFVYPFFHSFTAIVYKKPRTGNKMDLYLKPFRIRVNNLIRDFRLFFPFLKWEFVLTECTEYTCISLVFVHW